MPRLLPALLFCVASVSAMAWELTPQNMQAAVQGDPLAETIADAGLPLPPTRLEAQVAAGLRYGLERSAIKRCLVYRTSLAKSARNRISPEINRSTAAMAKHLGAPALFGQYLELMADDTLSRRQQYALNQAFNYLVRETYSIDALLIRVVSESLQLPPAEHVAWLLQLPVAHMFDQTPPALPPRERLLADVQTMTSVLRSCDTILRSVHDRATADAAALRLQELLPLWNTTLALRAHSKQAKLSFTPAENFAVQLLDTTTSAVYQTRQRLHENDWFGSTRLRVADELLR